MEFEAEIWRIVSTHEYYKTAKYELQTPSQTEVRTKRSFSVQNFHLPILAKSGLPIKSHPYYMKIWIFRFSELFL